MSKRDLQLFLDKVKQLQEMVRSLEEEPSRKALLEECTNHNQVVELAKKWGFQIGRRWGEPEPVRRRFEDGNLLAALLPQIGEQRKVLIKKGLNWRLDLAISCSYISDEGKWLKNDSNIWFVLLKGSVRIEIFEEDSFLDLSIGDQYHIKPNMLHRVVRTDPSPGTFWLEFSWVD